MNSRGRNGSESVSSASVYSNVSSQTPDLTDSDRATFSSDSSSSSYLKGTNVSVEDIWNAVSQNPSETIDAFLDKLPFSPNFAKEDAIKLLKTPSSQTSAEIQENRLEFLTVWNILSSANELHEITSLPESQEMFVKEKTLCFSFSKLFRYHFQLPFDHPNFGFKRFGSLLADSQVSLVLTVMRVCVSSMEYHDRSFWKLRRLLTLTIALYSGNVNLTQTLIADFHVPDNIRSLRSVVNFPSDGNSSILSDHRGPLSILNGMQELSSFFDGGTNGDSILELTISSDTSSAILASLLFLLELEKKEKLLKESDKATIAWLATSCITDNEHEEVFLVYMVQHPDVFRLFSGVDFGSSEIGKLTDYFMKAVSLKLVENFTPSYLENLGFTDIIQGRLSAITLSLYGLSAPKSGIPEDVFVPIFELVNQNMSLKFIQEHNLLVYLYLSINTLDRYITDNSTMTDCLLQLDRQGCSLSLNALLDDVQYILSYALNEELATKMTGLVPIPNDFREFFGLDCIPPVRRENTLFDAPFQSEESILVGSFTEESLVRHGQLVCVLKDCIERNARLRRKVYRLLSSINRNSGLLVRTKGHAEEESEQSLYKYHLNSGYKLAGFEDRELMNYKLAYFGIGTSIKADVAMLVVVYNLKGFDLTFSSALSRSISDTLLSIGSIYMEFGILTMYKIMIEACERSVRLANEAAMVLAEILPNPKRNVEENARKKDFAEMIHSNTIASNLIRLFVEEFDDGKTIAFKKMINFLKNHPSSLKPKKRERGTVKLDAARYWKWVE